MQYGDVISELLQAGINVYAMDWRSQGLSGRHLLDPQVCLKIYAYFCNIFVFCPRVGRKERPLAHEPPLAILRYCAGLRGKDWKQRSIARGASLAILRNCVVRLETIFPSLGSVVSFPSFH